MPNSGNNNKHNEQRWHFVPQVAQATSVYELWLLPGGRQPSTPKRSSRAAVTPIFIIAGKLSHMPPTIFPPIYYAASYCDCLISIYLISIP